MCFPLRFPFGQTRPGHLPPAACRFALAALVLLAVDTPHTRSGFHAALSFDTGKQAYSVAVGDFNGDGIPDLAVANVDSNSVSVLLGKGDGTFQAAVNYAGGSGAISVTVKDLNGDGFVDLVVAAYYSNAVNVLLGNGDGTFQPARSYTAGIQPRIRRDSRF
jgi:hypothetical protein